MLAAAGSIFGLFLLSSLYLQNVLGMGPLTTGLAFIPIAVQLLVFDWRDVAEARVQARGAEQADVHDGRWESARVL